MVLCIDSELNHILKVIIGAIIFLAILFFSTNSFAAEIFVEASDQSAVRIPGVTITLDACTISRDYNIITSVQTMRNCAVGYYRFYLKNLNYLGGSVTSVSWYFYNINTGERTIYDGRTEREGATGYYIDIYIPDGGAEYAMHGFVNFMANDGTSYSFRFGNAQVGHPNMQAYLAHYHTEGAAATCTTAQTCTKCGTTLQAALGHNFTGSYSRYDNNQHRRKCSRCDTYEYVNHTKSTTYVSNGSSGHYRTCTVCNGRTEDNVAHSLSSWSRVDNTNHTRSCSVCSYSETKAHTKSTTYTSNGSSGHYRMCTVCSGRAEADASHSMSSWSRVDNTNHKRTCSLCSYSETEAHTKSTTYTANGDSGHYRTCTVCSGRAEADASHSMGSWSRVDNTNHKRTCSICSYSETEAHTKSTTYTANGDSGHYRTCTVCSGRAEADAAHSDSSNPKNGLCNTCSYRMYYMATIPSYGDKTYNGSDQSVSAGTGYTLSGQTSGKAVGSYSVTATLINHSDGKPYKWSPDAATSTKSITWRILKRDITITALDQTTYYPTRITKTTAKVSGNNLCSGHSITSITLTETPSTTTYPTPNENGVGTGTITPSGATITSSTDGNVTSNYNIRYANGTWTLKDNTRPQGYLRANNPTAILIDGRMAYNIRNISLTMKATDDYAGVKEVYLFNENSIPSSVASISTWKNWATSSDLSFAGTDLKVINWTLSNGDGAKTVYLYIRDKAGNVSVTF